MSTPSRTKKQPQKTRSKIFGPGVPTRLDRNAKARIIFFATALSKARAPGQHYGEITAKALAVLRALLWDFHSGATGLCFPAYERIAAAAACARSTVAEAIAALERAGILSWANRIVRTRKTGTDLFGNPTQSVAVLRTSNTYTFADPGEAAHKHAQEAARAKSDLPTGTASPVIRTRSAAAHAPLTEPQTDLFSALERLRRKISAA